MASDIPKQPDDDAFGQMLFGLIAKQILLENLVYILVKDKALAEKYSADDISRWADAMKAFLSERVKRRTYLMVSATESDIPIIEQALLNEVDMFFHALAIGISN